MGLHFVINSILLGVGLAMDAFSVSMANGLENPSMKKSGMLRIAGMFAFFQWLMPMIGWICVHTIVTYFHAFEALIPWIALLLLGYIGGKMIYEGVTDKGDDGKETLETEEKAVATGTLIMQAIATSIDALSVGFTIANYQLMEAMLASVIIAIVTLFICLAGIRIGRYCGMKLAGKASIFGGVILVAIGLEIFISHM